MFVVIAITDVNVVAVVAVANTVWPTTHIAPEQHYYYELPSTR